MFMENIADNNVQLIRWLRISKVQPRRITSYLVNPISCTPAKPSISNFLLRSSILALNLKIAAPYSLQV